MNLDIKQVGTLMYDKTFRANLIKDVDTHAEKLGYVKSGDTKFKVIKNTQQVFYLALPYISDELTADSLANVNAAGAFTVSTAGSVGSLSSTVSTAGSAGTALVVNGKVY